MKETNLFSFPTQLKSEAIPSKRNKKKTSIAVFNQVDTLFIENLPMNLQIRYFWGIYTTNYDRKAKKRRAI